jgi:hypothetical protein
VQRYDEQLSMTRSAVVALGVCRAAAADAQARDPAALRQ